MASANFSSVVNSPRQSWATFLGLPDDLDEYTLEDVRLSVSSYMVKSSSLAPIVAHERERILTLSDFTEYMRRVGQPYAFMAAHRSQLAVGEGCDSTSFAAVTDCSAGLKQVPPVCFEEDFKLCRPRTFDHFSPPDQPHSSMVTLEKLAGHLDTVELKLLSEVSSRQHVFFTVLSSYKQLRQQVAASCDQIEQLRTKMRSLEANLVNKSLLLPVLVRRRAHSAALLEKLRLMHAAWATQPTIQQLLAARDFAGALDLISSSQRLLATELSGICALKKLGLSLATTKRQISHIMSKDLLQLALGHEVDGEVASAPKEVLVSELESRLVPVGVGLLRLRLLGEALGELDEHLLRTIRALVKRRLQEELTAMAHEDMVKEAAMSSDTSGNSGRPSTSVDGDARSHPEAAEFTASASVSRQLQKLTTERFEAVMAGVVAAVMVLLRRSAAIHQAVLKALASPGGLASAAGDEGQEYSAQMEARSLELLVHACELAQERYAKLLNKRKEVHARMRLVDFVRISKCVLEFIRDVAHLCPTARSVLATELEQHSAEFLRATHEAAKSQLTAVVEAEQWKQVEVRPEFQRIADALVRHQIPMLAESELVLLREPQLLDTSAAPRELFIDGVGHKVVGSTLMLLLNAAYYMQCVAAIPTVGPQVAQLLPALLRLFHEITFKQVLHGGAMRADAAAGLKVITAKHLALASQALAVVLAFLPHLKAILAAYVPESQPSLLNSADDAATDYASHQDQLFSKLVTMLEDRRRGHMGVLATQLTPSEEKRRPEPTESVKQVIKDMMHMYKVLEPLLCRQQLHTVFERLLATFDVGLLAAYRKADTSILFTRQCIVADVLYLKQEVSKLHLTLPNGCCPELVAFAKSLNVA